MSSIQASFAQNKSRSFVTVGTGKCIVPDNLVADLATAGADNVGTDYTIYDIAKFNTFTGLSGYSTHALAAGETLIDLGKQITVGLDGVDGVLLKFRLVKRTLSSAAADTPIDGEVVYVVVENNVSFAATVSGNSRVTVARV